MKKLTICAIAFITLPLMTMAQGTLVEDTIIRHLSYDDIEGILVENGISSGIMPSHWEVDVHRVIYNTPDQHGNPTTASGLIFLPSNDTCAMPMLAYLHGTKLRKSNAFYFLGDEWSLGAIIAATGYAVCFPDYLGLGAGSGIHPYLHAQSEATASIDIMRSCRMICEEDERELNDQLFLIGYSQGGHSVMATHKMIQEELSNEFTVTASAPGSGPYDLTGSQLDMVSSFDPYAEPGYLPFLVQSYQNVYGDLYDSIQQIYIPPYDQTIPPLLDGTASMWHLNQAMPDVPREIFQPAYADAFFTDTVHPAFVALKNNDVYEWTPEAPVMFNYCRNDEEVTYLNTVVASDHMIASGATDIQVIERDTVVGHYECASPSIFFSKLWFDTMAEFCPSDGVGVSEIATEPHPQPFPNPVSDGVIQFSNEQTIEVQFLDIQGRQLGVVERVKPGELLNIEGIPSGIVLVNLFSENNIFTHKLVIQ